MKFNSLLATFPDLLMRRMLFFSGKGGVGRSTLSRSMAQQIAAKGKKVLWVTFEDPSLPRGLITIQAPNVPEIYQYNIFSEEAFTEYLQLKLGAGPWVKFFLKNSLLSSLVKLAPGIHEIVLLGKAWYERNNYDHVVVDLPSSGIAASFFQSTVNMAELFSGSYLSRDATAMLETFRNPSECAFIVVTTPEEMPIQEAIEHATFLWNFANKNRIYFSVNRKFPTPLGASNTTAGANLDLSSQAQSAPIAKDAAEYFQKKWDLENQNLAHFSESIKPFGSTTYATEKYHAPQLTKDTERSEDP